MPDVDRSTIVENIRDAVHNYARAEVQSLARRAIYRLQRVEASGIYGDDHKFKSLWDEFCHEIQNGPYEPLEEAWDDVINRTLGNLTDTVARPTSVLLTILAVHDLDEDQGAGLLGTVWKEGIVQLIRDELLQDAGDRCIDHLG